MTPQGLKPDPAKIEAITPMNIPKFMPHLTKTMEPPHRLEDKDAEWHLVAENTQYCFQRSQNYLPTESPVPKYFNVNKEVTIWSFDTINTQNYRPTTQGR